MFHFILFSIQVAKRSSLTHFGLDHPTKRHTYHFILELSPVDLNRFRTLQKADKQLQAAFKLSKKQGGNLDEDGED